MCNTYASHNNITWKCSKPYLHPLINTHFLLSQMLPILSFRMYIFSTPTPSFILCLHFGRRAHEKKKQTAKPFLMCFITYFVLILSWIRRNSVEIKCPVLNGWRHQIFDIFLIIQRWILMETRVGRDADRQCFKRKALYWNTIGKLLIKAVMYKRCVKFETLSD